MNTPDTNPLDVLTNPDREAEKRELYERALEKTQAEQESKTTPDTEWEKLAETMIVESDICTHKGLHDNGMCTGKIHLASGTYLELKKTLATGIESLISSRDTYWKERVRKEVEQAVDECVKIVNNKVRWAKDADPDEVYEELRAVAGIKEVCEACGERHITKDNLK